MPRKPRFGHIYQRTKKLKNGTMKTLPTWWIAYYYEGRLMRESSKSVKLSDAEALLLQRRAEILEGIVMTDVRNVTVAELLDALLLDYDVNGKSVAWAKYVDKHLRRFFGQMPASRVGTTAIQRYIAARRASGRQNATINRELSLLRRAFRLGAECSPPKVLRVPKIPKLEEGNVRKGFFEHADFLRVREALPDYLRPVVTFAYWTGCRKGEILSLQWRQVDLTEGIVQLAPGETKNDEARVIPLASELLSVLTLQKEARDIRFPDCPWVFDRAGERIVDFRTAWESACMRAGLVDKDGKPTHLFHDLRRTGVRNLIRAGVPERVAMAISGHKTRSVFDRYNIVSTKDLREAAIKLGNYIAAGSEGEEKADMHTPFTPEGQAAKRRDYKRLN
jgi:integrase